MGDDIRNCITKEKTELQKIERYSRCLSLDTAIETIKWETDQLLFKREYFVSKSQDELYIFCSAQNKNKPDEASLDLAIAIESPLLSESLAFENELFVIGERRIILSQSIRGYSLSAYITERISQTHFVLFVVYELLKQMEQWIGMVKEFI